MRTSVLPVMEEFSTIQGEGYHAGRAAYFIRLEGCDVGCFWCDVKESWDITGRNGHGVSDLTERALASKTGFVVVTGGEPLMHDLDTFTGLLNERGMETAIETSGTHPLTGSWHWICFSPKKFKSPLPEFYECANELKIIVYNKHDLEWAESHANKVGKNCKLYLQPEWDKREEVLPILIKYIGENPKWNLSLQTHKYIGVP